MRTYTKTPCSTWHEGLFTLNIGVYMSRQSIGFFIAGPDLVLFLKHSDPPAVVHLNHVDDSNL